MSHIGTLLRPALALHLVAWGFGAHAADDAIDRRVIGKWKILSVLDRAEISGLSGREANRLVGTVVTISEQKTTIGTRICAEPELTAEEVELTLHLRKEAHATGERLRLPNPVTVVDLGCADAYIRSPDQVVVSWNGVFFDTMKVKPTIPATRAHPR
jgi:hypothetical protein